MTTKFILHGGFTPGDTREDNSNFYAEILREAPEEPRILLVCFAKDVERIPVAIKRAKTEFNGAKWQKKLIFEVATEEAFVKQAKIADVIYLHGGISLKLLKSLQKFPNLKNLFKGKIIAGESAGANVLGQFFYSKNADTVSGGLGLLPLRIIPHYSEEYERKLDDVGQGLELLLLPEYIYKVFLK